MRSATLGSTLLFLSATAQAASVTYNLAPSAMREVRFTVDAPLDSIIGLSEGLSGSVSFDSDTLALAAAKLKVDPTSFSTGIGLRDEDLRDQFFEVARYPDITLTLQKLTRASAEALAPGAHVQADVTALFALHGVEHNLTFPITLERSADGTAIAVRGSFSVVLADYHIKRPQKLFLKLGEVARVDVHATFAAVQTFSAQPVASSGAAAHPAMTSPATAAAPAAHDKIAPPAARRVARKSIPRALLPQARKPAEAKFVYAFNTAEGRGERLLSDASIGGPGNAVSCASCHDTVDERLTGFVTDGIVRPSRSLFDVAHRPEFWQGFAKTVGKASSLCAKMYMLKPDGLDDGKQQDLEAYLAKVSPDDIVPGLDYRVLLLTKKTELAHATAGDAKNGQRLAQRYCESCHGVGEIRPPLTPGLYEPEYIVQRVRWLPGTDAKQMPPMYLDRLTDSELRDIVTYLAGDEDQRIFKRNRAPTTPAGVPTAPPGSKAQTQTPPGTHQPG